MVFVTAFFIFYSVFASVEAAGSSEWSKLGDTSSLVRASAFSTWMLQAIFE